METRGTHMAMCLNYTWPFGHVHWNMWPHGRMYKIHAAIRTRVINTHVQTATCINTRGLKDTFINPHGSLNTCIYYTCPSSRVYYLHSAIWPRAFITHGQTDTCNKYMWRNVSQLHVATLSLWHVATVTATVAMWQMPLFFVVLKYFRVSWSLLTTSLYIEVSCNMSYE